MLLAMSINNSEKQILEEIINLMMKDDSADAPEDAVKWSKNLFRTRAAAEPKKSLVQKVLAILQMDLAPNKAAFGERSAGTAQERQMLFQAGESNAVDLRIRHAAFDGALNAGECRAHSIGVRQTQCHAADIALVGDLR